MYCVLLHSEDSPWAAEMPFLFLLVKTMNSTWVCVGCLKGNVQRTKDFYLDPSQKIQVLSFKLEMSPGAMEIPSKKGCKIVFL